MEEQNNINLNQLPLQLTNLTNLLTNLSNQIVSSRLNQQQQLLNTQEPESFDAEPYLLASAPIFATLNSLNRNSLVYAKLCKVKTQEARLEMDTAHLRLQNLMFERNHLEREIKKCEEFESEYQNLPLLSVPEFIALSESLEPPPGLTIPLPTDAHELMLARLAFELSERTRLDEEKKELIVRKGKLIKLNESKKLQLEDLEKKLDQFVTNAKEIQAKMHSS